MCATCDHGFCARHDLGARYILDFDPFYEDSGYEAVEEADAVLSMVEFKTGDGRG